MNTPVSSNDLVSQVRDAITEMAAADQSATAEIALQLAAWLVEFTAYELARAESSENVAQMIQLSAELDRVAKRYAVAKTLHTLPD